MAASEASKKLSREATCFLCCHFLTDPVVLECRHIFCKGCIRRCWENLPTLTVFCPLCRKEIQRVVWMPNQQLGTVVDTARQLADQVMKEAEDWGVCKGHKEPLKMFCMFDCAPICVVCKGFKKHEDHTVVPAEDAAEEYKAQIGTSLEILMKSKKELLAFKENAEKQGQDFTDMIERERQRTVAVFRDLREFLEEEENRLLAQMEKLDQEIAKKRDEDIAMLSEELSSLEKDMQEMKEACEKPPRELLKDIKGMIQRYEQKGRFETPVPFPPAIKWRIWDFWEINSVLENVAKKFKDALKSESPQHKEMVTLYPETAHPQLVISKDRRSVSVSDQPQIWPEGVVLRFSHYRSVLGSIWFQSGRHFWEVDVGNEEGWVVGISIATVQCNEDKPLGPAAGVWAIGKWNGQYQALIHPLNPPLCVKKEPKKIRVSLNYTGGQVAFFDAETATMLYCFSIPGQPASRVYYPFFWLRMNCKLSLGL